MTAGGVNEPGTKTGGTSVTVTVAVAMLVPPKPSETVSVTVSIPTVLKTWDGVGPVAVSPSPNDQEYVERIAVGIGRAAAVERDGNTLVDRQRRETDRRRRRIGSPPSSFENSDVLPAGSVAVAVTNLVAPDGVGNAKEKAAVPEAPIVSGAEPSRYRPSP